MPRILDVISPDDSVNLALNMRPGLWNGRSVEITSLAEQNLMYTFTLSEISPPKLSSLVSSISVGCGVHRIVRLEMSYAL